MKLVDAKRRWSAMPRWKKVASVGGALFVLSLFFGGLKIRRYFWQGALPWGPKLLGRSTTTTIGSAGCLLTALTMAINSLKGTTLTPDDANNVIKAAGWFSGANLDLSPAAAMFATRADEKDRIRDTAKASAATIRARVDDALARGGLALVHVSKDLDSGGEHFILVHKKTGAGYAGADPATAKDTFLSAATMSGVAMWGKQPVNYRAVGVAPIFKA